MTITGTSTHHDLMVAWARHDIEALTGPNPSREKAGRVLHEWHSWEALTDAEIADVLAAYYPAEPPMVAGLDFLPEQVHADAEAVVAGTLDEADWSLYDTCHICNAAAGMPCVRVHVRPGTYRRTVHFVRPLVEVAPQPNAEVQP